MSTQPTQPTTSATASVADKIKKTAAAIDILITGMTLFKEILVTDGVRRFEKDSYPLVKFTNTLCDAGAMINRAFDKLGEESPGPASIHAVAAPSQVFGLDVVPAQVHAAKWAAAKKRYEAEEHDRAVKEAATSLRNLFEGKYQDACIRANNLTSAELESIRALSQHGYIVSAGSSGITVVRHPDA